MQDSDPASKTAYFDKLYSLSKTSGKTEWTAVSKRQETLKEEGLLSQKSPRPPTELLTLTKTSLPKSNNREHHAIDLQKKVPGLLRTRSEPISKRSEVNETPLIQKASLLRYDISTPPSTESSFEEGPTSNLTSSNLAPQKLEQRPQEQRTVSDPLVLKNSTGIATMLQKKQKQTQKRKRGSEIKLVDEKDRIFHDQTFFYIPNDDVAKIRKLQITKAQNYGATWTREFGIHVTHVIVEKDLTYQAVLSYMRSAFAIDAFPTTMSVVNTDYPLECILFRALLNPEQTQYMVTGRRIRQQNETSDPVTSEEIHESPQRGVDCEDADNRQTSPRKDSPEEEQEQDHGVVERSKEVETSTNFREDSSPRWKGFGDNEEFDEIIQFARETRLMPEDDDTECRSSTADSNKDQDNSDREESPDHAPSRTKKRRIGPESPFNQEAFSCMSGGKGAVGGENPNDEIIKDFMKMAAYYERTKDQWRNMSYRKAITALRRQTTKITTYEQAIQLPCIGDSLASKIEERHLNGRLAKLDYTNMDPRDRILQKFTKIYGVGSSQADKWINQGHKTLEDLTANVYLTRNQKIGIAHYDDFNTRIPRSEMDLLAAIVKDAVKKIDPEVEATIGGSYRRGALTSGDIDFMLTKSNTTSTSELLPFLHTLITYLTQTSFLVAALAVPRHGSNSGSKWHGACVLPTSSIWRRIDLLLVPASEWGAALIYFTGDDIFNRSLRLLASKKGMRLNQRGLFEDCMREPGRVKMTEGRLIEGLSERGIFERLGVPWRAPEDRILN